MEEHCADHSDLLTASGGTCARIVNLEKEQCVMKKRLDKIWYLMLTTLVGVIVTLVTVLSSHLFGGIP
jgi:hypothetical protein